MEVTSSKILVELTVPGKSHHDLGQPKREAIPLIDLPEMDGLPVRLADLLEVLALDGAWDTGHEEEPTLDLELVRVPQWLLLVGQSEEVTLRDDVLDPDEPGLGIGAVVDQALPHVLVQAPAEMVGLHLPSHVMRKEMEPDIRPDSVMSAKSQGYTKRLKNGCPGNGIKSKQ